VEKEMMDEEKATINSKINQLSKVLGRINEVKKELRRSKIMIVGEGYAGKSAFANSIIGKIYEETESTVGINTFMCSVTHAALSKSEWKKCEKIEKEYENAIAEHLSFMKEVDIEGDHNTQQESSQIVGKKDRNGLDTRMASYAVDHQDGGKAALDHSKGDSSTDSIDQSRNAKVDKDMIVKYLANHVEIGANILISIFDYGGQTVFNVSTMFIYIKIILFADICVNPITVF
jgi:GTPase SAR1 family protein